MQTFLFPPLLADVITLPILFYISSSGYEVSMCFEQIFGDDVDFFSWDYGMTDGRDNVKLLHYGYRGGLTPGHPAIMGFHIGGRAAGSRVERLKRLEELGMASFVGLSTGDAKLYEKVPDSSGLSDSELDAMPEYVRNFKCEGKMEGGDPYCGKEKYTTRVCSPRSKQVGWHPGL
jgi:hypothetical protein